MIVTQNNINLKPLTTFGFSEEAETLITIDSEQDLENINEQSSNIKIVGGGSNICLTKKVKGLTILNRIKGVQVLNESTDYVYLKVASGEIWHELVMFAVDNNWSGIENLALIPGTVGAAPIQNIGAYGVEVKDTIVEVHAWEWATKTIKVFANQDCHFGYRDSVFKNQYAGQYCIVAVVFKLSKNQKINTSYGNIQQELEANGITHPTIKDVANAVIAIRQSKLPDPTKIGNAGSFFKNPTINKTHFSELHSNFPEMPFYVVNENLYKIPAAWLIEQCGWKGYQENGVGVHHKQALVLVNLGNGNGNSIVELSTKIITSVQDKFGVTLEREVQIW